MDCEAQLYQWEHAEVSELRDELARARGSRDSAGPSFELASNRRDFPVCYQAKISFQAIQHKINRHQKLPSQAPAAVFSRIHPVSLTIPVSADIGTVMLTLMLIRRTLPKGPVLAL